MVNYDHAMRDIMSNAAIRRTPSYPRVSNDVRFLEGQRHIALMTAVRNVRDAQRLEAASNLAKARARRILSRLPPELQAIVGRYV